MDDVKGRGHDARIGGSPVSWFVDAAVGAVIVVVFWILPMMSASDLSAASIRAGVFLAIVVFTAVLLRWRCPVLAPAAALLATATGWAMGLPNSDPMLAAAWCLYPMALRRGARARRVGLISVGAIVLASGLLAFTSDDRFNAQRAVTGVGAIGVSWLLGHAEARRMNLAQQAVEQQAEFDRIRAQEAMAREVHDVVGHALSVISAEADVARHLPDSDENELRESLAGIERRARGALEDVQGLVRALRAGKQAIDDAEHGPASETLPRLATAARATGLEVTTHIDLPEIPIATSHVLIRIVQEALSNIIRHAHASRCEIAVWQDDGALIVRIDDDGEGLPSALRPGNGLVGMRERVEEAGGQLTITNRLDGGARVLAQLPGGTAR